MQNCLLINGKIVAKINENSTIEVKPKMTNSFNGFFSNNNGTTIIGGKVIIDGVEYNTADYADNQPVHITVTGNVRSINTVSGDVSVTGAVHKAETLSGSIDVTGAVSGDVKTMSGSIRVGGNVMGDVSSMSGSIRHGK